MSTAVSVPWSSILLDSSTGLDGMTSLPSADILKLYRPHADVGGDSHSFDLRGRVSEPYSDSSASDRDLTQSHSDIPEKRLPNVADWGGTLDFITGMAGVTADQRNDLEEQTQAQQRALEDLRRELTKAQRRLRASEQRAQKLQAQADRRLQKLQADLDAQVQKARAETEARVRVIHARTAGLIRSSEERVRTAELRAQNAEDWLKRIDAATKNLLLNGHMTRTEDRPDWWSGRPTKATADWVG